MFNFLKQKKLIFNFFVNRNWKKITDSRKRAKILADNRKSHHPIETLTYVSKEDPESWLILFSQVYKQFFYIDFRKKELVSNFRLSRFLHRGA